MTPEAVSLAALVCFALGAAVAIAGFRVEALRKNSYQFILVGLGVLLKTVSIGMHCARSDSHFFTSPSEVYGLLAWALSCSFLVALAVSAARSLGAIILPLVTVLLTISHLLTSESTASHLKPNPYLAPHILSAFLGYGLFLTACGGSVLYLEQARLLKRKIFGAIFRDLPSLERLERLEISCAWLGLIAFTVAILTGAVMAQNLQQPFWLEPKILATEITWLIFFGLLVGRAVRRLNGRAAAKFVLAGAALVLCTFLLTHPAVKSPTTAIERPGAKSRRA